MTRISNYSLAKSAARRREGGFSLAELVIAVAVAGIALALIYKIFGSFYRSWTSEGLKSDMRQNARVALDTVTRDLEMAGYHSTQYGDVNKANLAVTLARTFYAERVGDGSGDDDGICEFGEACVEIVGDGIGDDAGDCETGEVCEEVAGDAVGNDDGVCIAGEVCVEYDLDAVGDNDGICDIGEVCKELSGDGVGDDDDICEQERCAKVRDEFEVDQHYLDIGTGFYQPKMVFYHLDQDAEGRQNLYRQVRSSPGAAAADELIAEDVEDFFVTYFDEGGEEIIPPPPSGYAYSPGTAPPQQLKDIRRVCVEIKTRPNRVHPWMKMNAPDGEIVDPSFTLSSCVTPRNFSVDPTAVDTTAPCVPANLRVVDTKDCNTKLCVSWNKCTDPDLDGYVLHYGAAGTLMLPVGTLSDSDNPQAYLSTDDLLITKNADRVTSPNTYVVSVSSYDSSGNRSGRSTRVSGNPDPDVSDCTSGTGDTTVNPAKPSPPENFIVAPGGEMEIILSWDPPADGSATAGYRVYRSENPFADGAFIDPADPAITVVADESTLDTLATTYTDDDPALVGCRTYYYAIASVNCDETLVSTYLHDTAGDYAAGSGDPQDTTPPPAASLEGTTAGWQRIFVSLQTPTADVAPDFERTDVYSNQGASCPYVDSDGNVVNGSVLPDSDSGTPGTFVSRGSQTILFDSETQANPTEPELANEGEYCLLAVTYDSCQNTAVDSSSVLTIALCGDDPPGPPPGWPEAPTFISCDPRWVNLTWSYPPKYWTGPGQIFDFAGYRLWREGPGAGATIELTSAPKWTESWQDAKDLREGGNYRYEIRATDCVYENRYADFPNNYSAPLYVPTDTGWISPGRVRLFPGDTDNPFLAQNFVSSFSDTGQPYSYHNNIRFFIQNTSRSTMDILKITVSWANESAVLDRISVGGPPSTSTSRSDILVGGTPSGVPASVGVTVNDTAVGIDQLSGPVPVELRFTNQDGSVNQFTDMRGERLVISVQTHNRSLQYSSCDPESFVVLVPQGPELTGFFQTALPTRPDETCPFSLPSLEVPGSGGTSREDDLQAPPATPVNVFGTALDTSGPFFDFVDGTGAGSPRGFTTLSLFYVDALLEEDGTVPAMPTGTTPVELPLVNLGGDLYGIYDAGDAAADPVVPPNGSPIPDFSDRAVWYYILAVDRTGTFARLPDPSAGSFAYFQAAFEICKVRPAPPLLSGTKLSDTVTLTWEAPTRYTNCGDLHLSDALTYDVFRQDANDGSIQHLCGYDPGDLTLPACPSSDPLAFSDTDDMAAGSFSYTVTATNGCAGPEAPGVSDHSNVVYEDGL